ncbi:hypothetical protein [Flavihumibacter fluvii]|uniref:hypothetical protein n=1 Tax=Flavihumibacter fluvii TaxID=2838157 RepID=UPI001BDE5B46|nr:hypothetical protein [Flavihumibacter fluvii]ULQ51976.1 hypothetical protein KJS93_17945 [Flavihumibacter fluvii]
MTIAITDANIFIDLIETEMLGFLFDLDLEIHTTYEVYNQLNTDQEKVTQIFVQSKALFLYSFSFDELQEIASLEFPAGLEMADRSVYYYATKVTGIILSGDRKLKNYCERNHKQVKGIIWVFDQVFEKELLPPDQLAAKMKLLLKINSRLPYDECHARIAKWGK